MHYLTIMGSGSGGNCAILHNESHSVDSLMIDAGVRPKQIKAKVALHNIRPESIKYAVITHLHTDHLIDSTFNYMAKSGISLICHENHFDEIERKQEPELVDLMIKQDRILIYGFQDEWIKVDDRGVYRVKPFELSHDKRPVAGYDIVVNCPEGGSRICWITDTGTLSGTVCKDYRKIYDSAVNCDHLFIESNYSRSALMNSDRDECLKNRIDGPLGHLSNEQCAKNIRDWLEHRSAIGKAKWRSITLLHGSTECNNDYLCKSEFDSILGPNSFEVYGIRRADQDESSRLHLFDY